MPKKPLKKQQNDPTYFVHVDIPVNGKSNQYINNTIIAGDSNEIVDDWIQVCKSGEIINQGSKRFDYQGNSYAVNKTKSGSFYASDGFCTHGNSHLADGMVIDNIIECSKHNGRFDLKTGEPKRSPVGIGLNTYDVRETNVIIWMSLASIRATSERKKATSNLSFDEF